MKLIVFSYKLLNMGLFDFEHSVLGDLCAELSSWGVFVVVFLTDYDAVYGLTVLNLCHNASSHRTFREIEFPCNSYVSEAWEK